MADPGIIVLQDDFGVAATPPQTETDLAGITKRANDIRASVRYVQERRPTSSMTKAAILERIRQVWDEDLGPFDDQAREIAELANSPKAPPEPLPSPLVVGHAGSYGGHDPAVDAYLGGEWGPHHGIWCVAPVDGTVELYQFPTPLDVYEALDAAAQQAHRELFHGWVCCVPELGGDLGHATAGADSWWVTSVTPAQTMYVPVFRPAAPLSVDGVRLAWLGTGHVDGAQVTTGRVAQGTRLWRTWDSGVRFEDRNIVARAAHGHFICGTSAQLSPNGDAPGWLAIQAFGFPSPRRHGVPGPQDYMGGGYIAGRPRADWAGREIPPIPV